MNEIQRVPSPVCLPPLSFSREAVSASPGVALAPVLDEGTSWARPSGPTADEHKLGPQKENGVPSGREKGQWEAKGSTLGNKFKNPHCKISLPGEFHVLSPPIPQSHIAVLAYTDLVSSFPPTNAWSTPGHIQNLLKLLH